MNLLLAYTSLNGQDALNLVIQLVLVGLCFWLILWFIGWVGVPEPFLKVIKVILGLVVLIFLINLVMGMGGHPLIKWN
jgi:ABC-type multidrug transport system permease subunit